jgi:hypothetical protein
MTESSETDRIQEDLQPRSQDAYIVVNTLKWMVILGLPLIVGRFQFRLSRLNLDLLGFTVFALVLSGVVRFLASLIQWKKIEDRVGQAVSGNRKESNGKKLSHS